MRVSTLQVSYTFSRDFLSLLRKDDNIAEFGRTSVLIRGLQRVCSAHTLCLLCYSLYFVAFYPPFASIAKGEVFVLLYVFTRHSLVREKGEVFVLLLLFCLFFVNYFSTTRGPIHAKFCTRADSDSECVFSPLGRWRPPASGKRGK